MPRSPPGFMERFQGLSRSFRDRGDDSSSSKCSTARDHIFCFSTVNPLHVLHL